MTPIPVVLVCLLLDENTYLLSNSDIVHFVWKTDKGVRRGTESIVLLIFVL